jgi:sulfatase modifying factor 1
MTALLLVPLSLGGARAAVDAGQHTPFYPPTEGQESVEVAAFTMDVTPVTNAEFAAFIKDNPKWARDAVPAVFAESGYLSEWSGPADFGVLHPDHPVTAVSWFAARAYCQAAGGDLPTVYQWEYAADATATAPHGARRDPDTLALILAWYGAGPGARLRPVGQGAPNFWGIEDLHGLVWEWTLDFNSLLISADIRESGEGENLRFCGAGALSARDVEDYASFMRFAMRSALGASFTTDNLGFRCAYAR